MQAELELNLVDSGRDGGRCKDLLEEFLREVGSTSLYVRCLSVTRLTDTTTSKAKASYPNSCGNGFVRRIGGSDLGLLLAHALRNDHVVLRLLLLLVLDSPQWQRRWSRMEETSL